jgi:hypothetical protein
VIVVKFSGAQPNDRGSGMSKWVSKWASVIGLVMTAFGILVGFYLPTIAARWSGPETIAQECWLQTRYITGIVLVLVGTALQVCGSWPK